MSNEGYFAIEGANGIEKLQLGPVEVTWHKFDDRVNVVCKTASKRVDVYSSATGRSLRVFDGKGNELKSREL